MCVWFALNFGGYFYTSTKQENLNGVAFNTREHVEVYYYVVKIYIEVKAMHGGIGPIPVILAKDETKGKSRITWEA